MRTDVEPAEPSRARVYATALLIVAAGALAYANSFPGALVFDDFPAIRENPTIRQLWPLSGALSPPSDTGIGGRPLANLTFALNYAVSGLDLRGLHVGNLLLHLGSALLLFGLVRRTLAYVGRDGFVPAAAAALVWTVHPLTTAAVTWLSQRTELLMAFLYLLTLYAFVRAIAGPGRGWCVVSVTACALGMASKEVMVTAPVVVLLYDRTFFAGSLRSALVARRWYYLGLAATWGVLAYLLTTGLHQRGAGFGLGVSGFRYAITEARAIVIYLRLAAWPAMPIFDYGAIYTAPVAISVLGVAFVVTLLGSTVMAVRRGSQLGFAAACFFLLLAPTSSFVPVAEQPIAENRMYLPLAVLTTVAMTGLSIVSRKSSRMTVLLLAPALALSTVARNQVYHGEIALWADTVRKRPENPRAAYNGGIALLEAGRAADAVGYFERALRHAPLDPKSHHSLGNALVALGRPADALPHFAEAVRLQPNYPRAWCNYGTALLRTGDAAGAIARLERSLQLDSHSAAAHHALGNALFQLDRPADALVHYVIAAQLDPQDADAQYNCGSACLELGRLDEAIVYFTSAARLKPHDAEVRNNLGAALLRAGRVSEAIIAFETALQMRPDYDDARDNLRLARETLARVAR